jgi:hypothetical protein
MHVAVHAKFRQPYIQDGYLRLQGRGTGALLLGVGGIMSSLVNSLEAEAVLHQHWVAPVTVKVIPTAIPLVLGL